MKHPPIEEILADHVAEGGAPRSKIDRDFITIMRACADKGVAFGFMMQAIEWEWNHREEKEHGAARGVFGPLYFEAKLAEKDREIARLKSELKRKRAPSSRRT